MKFYRHGSQYAEFLGIDPFLAELIRQIPQAADAEDSALAQGRIFSSPSPDNAELAADWKELVVPELKTQFRSAVSLVEHDLAENLCESDGDDDFPFRLQIPLEHTDAWLSALNQARLVLTSRYEFSDEELNERFPPQLKSLRELVLYQITIYGWMQELLLTTLP
ncbi:MAG: DUF2017 family protein [Chthoniobacterales bacterium]